jgi:catechol 2,3-dioxygenase-like lactoylglutathione lyase family enzyme
MESLNDYGVHHVGFVVGDLEAAINQFSNIFGIGNFSSFISRPIRTWSRGGEIPGYEMKTAMTLLGNGSRIELIEPLSEKGLHREFLDSGKGGIHHIAFSVDHFEEWRKSFLEKGTKFVFEAELEDDENGYRRCFYAEVPGLDFLYEIRENNWFRSNR